MMRPSIPLISIVTTVDPSEKSMRELLRATLQQAMSQEACYEVIVVDDLRIWPQDDGLIAYAGENLDIRVISPERSGGQIVALARGVKLAKGGIIVTIDPDLYPCIQELPTIIDKLNNKIIAIHCERKVREDASPFRVFMSSITNLTFRFITRSSIRDIGSPLTILTRTSLTYFDLEREDGLDPRIAGYARLGPRLGTHTLKRGTTREKKSNYNISRLVRAGLRLIKASLLARRENLK